MINDIKLYYIQYTIVMSRTLRLFILTILLCETLSYNCHSSIFNRRNSLKLIGASTCSLLIKKSANAEIKLREVPNPENGNGNENNENKDNPPLTPEEMEEYQRLLKEAEKIKGIIDANKRAFLEEEKGFKEKLKQSATKYI